MAPALTDPPGDDLVARAEHAVSLAVGAPRRAAALATSVLVEAVDAGDRAAVSAAQLALGVTARELGDAEAAIRHLRDAAATARRAGLRAREGAARTSLVFVLLSAGRTAAAQREVARARPLVDRLDAARLDAQQALARQRLGDAAGAEEGLRRALTVFRRVGSDLDEARASTNLGIILAYRGDLAGAERLLQRALVLFDGIGLDLVACDVSHNLGWVAARRGDVPEALVRYDDAAARAAALGVDRPVYLLDRCEALLGVRLCDEALALAEQAASTLRGSGMRAELAEAELFAAQAALLGGRAEEARERAASARRGFLRQQRSPWAALASHVLLRAALDPPVPGTPARGGARPRGRRPSPAAARAVADELDAHGLVVPAADARLAAALLAMDRRSADAGADIDALRASRRRGPVELRARAWHAEALGRLRAGDRRGALRAVGSGLALLEDHQAVLGATELRVHASAATRELAELGVGLALEGPRADGVLTWTERATSPAGWARRARPPRSRALAAALVELRRASADVEAAAFAGAARPALVARQARLEGEVRRLARHERSTSSAPPRASAREAGDVLGRDGALLALVEHRGSLHAVVLTADGATRHDLGPSAPVIGELDHLGFALRRLARASPAAAGGAEPALGAARLAARRLDDLAVVPVSAAVGDRRLVVVPSPALLNVPWALLPSCRDRPVAIAPSVTAWVTAERDTRGAGGRALVVAGPGLDHAGEEAQRVAAAHPQVAVLTADAATATGVAGAVRSSSVLHVAAHARLRADNPLFSSFRLADGPLRLYDVEGWPRMPATVVLSACESAVSVTAGGAALGTAAVLLSLGARQVVASMVPVPDRLAPSMMGDLHDRVAGGAGPAAALAGVQAAVLERADGDPQALLAAAFSCFGACSA